MGMSVRVLPDDRINTALLVFLQCRIKVGAVDGAARNRRTDEKMRKVFSVLVVISLGGTISGKIIKTFTTRCHILKLKCTKFDFGWGSLQRFPDSLAGFKGCSSKTKERKEPKGK